MLSGEVSVCASNHCEAETLHFGPFFDRSGLFDQRLNRKPASSVKINKDYFEH